MEIIPFQKLSGEENMNLDASLLNQCTSSILRLYQWSEPTLTIGRNQTISNEINNYCKKHNIPIVKRITGGRALLHDKELTYCFVCHKNVLTKPDKIIESYKEISQSLVLGFQELGVELEFPQYKKVSVKSGYCMGLSTGSDLSYKGKKFIGSAQCRSKDYILQHGSILLDYDEKILKDIFNEPLNNLISLKQINPELCNIKLLTDTITKGFESVFDVK